MELFPRPATFQASGPDVGPEPAHLEEVLDALSEVSAASLSYLRLATDLPGGVLARCVEALAITGLLTAEERSDGHDGRRTIALTAKGRRAQGRTG